MDSLAQRVLSHIRRQELLKAGDRVGVAVSGGIDSVALLRLLLELRGELGIVLSVVHFNHNLRGAESDADQEFVAELARAHDLDFYADSDDVAQHAAEEHISVEAAARELRYGFFRHLLGTGGPQGLKPASFFASNGTAEAVPFHETPSLRQHSPGSESRIPANLEKIVTGHTLDDQAETVLLRLIRGAGLRGLAGIHPRIVVEDDEGDVHGEIVRPLLTIRRRELEEYLKAMEQPWREDHTNEDVRFTRNRVRKLVVPLLEKEFNPSVTENIAELAEIARGEEDYWDNEVAGWMGTGVHWSVPAWARTEQKPDLIQIASATAGQAMISSAQGTSPAADLRLKINNAPWLVMNASIDRLWFLGEPLAVQRRVIKAIGDEAGISLEFKHVEEIVRFATQEVEPGGTISLPTGWKVQREADATVFVTPDLREPAPVQDYEYAISVPGQLDICEIGSTIEVRRVSADGDAGYNPGHLWDADSLPRLCKVRNWRAGDRFWPNHSKSPKKIKELLQERHVPQAQRRLWPVVVSGDEIVWMRGFPPPARFAAKPGRQALAILERPLESNT
jgi:tRNA(Ile)-lysidine synthase